MIKFRGDQKAIRGMVERLHRTGQSTHLQDLNRSLAEESLDLVREGFELGEDPYGEKWPDPVLRDGRPLRDTGGLANSWHTTQTSAAGFTIESGKDYAIYHQGGTGIHGPRRQRIEPVRAKALRIPGVGFFRSVEGSPKRRMVPDAGLLPNKWRVRLTEAAAETLKIMLEGK